MTPRYDAIVLGVGGFGSGALYHLARRGVRVLGIERFGVAHDRGSSHGQTRIIRQAYFEHPDYVPLLFRAYELWHDLEQESRQTLFHQVGLFLAGEPQRESIAGTLRAARLHRLPVDELSAAQARRRFPGFVFPDGWTVVSEERAGYLAVEDCVRAHVEAACRHGAELRTGEAAVSIEAREQEVRVKTDGGEYAASRLIVTAGPWASQILQMGDLGPKAATALGPGREWLRVVRKPLLWFPAGPEYDVSRGTGTFFFETAEGQFYGFPRLDGRTVKVAEHTLGDPVPDPLTVDRTLHPADVTRIAEFLGRHLPGVTPSPKEHAVCMYTKTPDGHFIIDRHPEFASVILGMGFSGHGFKFTTVLGEALADLALDGRSRLPVDFLRLGRLK